MLEWRVSRLLLPSPFYFCEIKGNLTPRQKTLSKASVEDFLIIEYNGEIGGRVKHTNFGKQRDGSPYTIELGANWVWKIRSPLDVNNALSCSCLGARPCDSAGPRESNMDFGESYQILGRN